MRGNCATTATVLAFFLFFVLLESPTQLVIVSVVEGHHLSGQKKKFCIYDSSKQSIFRFLWTPELSQFGWQQFYDMREHWASFLIFHSVIASKTLIKWETIPNSVNIRMHCGLNFDNNRKKKRQKGNTRQCVKCHTIKYKTSNTITERFITTAHVPDRTLSDARRHSADDTITRRLIIQRKRNGESPLTIGLYSAGRRLKKTK